jgi:hypothetical protein
MKHLALLPLALAASAASAQQPMPMQDADRTVTADQAAYGQVRVNDTVSCPRSSPGYTSTYTFPIRFQTPFQNDRYAVVLGLSGAMVQPGQSLSYTTMISDRAREGMTISVTVRCMAGSRMMALDYVAIGRR